jgi:hypothetical protein
VRSGIVPELVKAMQWGVGYGQGDEEVVKFCCMALADLCLDSKDVRLAAVEAGAPAILSVVLQRMDDTGVCVCVWVCTCIFACRRGGGGSAVYDQGSINSNELGPVSMKNALNVVRRGEGGGACVCCFGVRSERSHGTREARQWAAATPHLDPAGWREGR